MRKLFVPLCSISLLLTVSATVAPAALAFEGTVAASGANVRSAPSLSTPIKKTLEGGEIVDVVAVSTGDVVWSVRPVQRGQRDLWYRLPSGGWVFSGLISASPSGSL